MAIRKRMNHVAAGLLHSFSSRCNDLEGFWALGMLYDEVQSEPYRVELDLLARTATPAGPNALAIAGRYAEFLRRALLKKKLRVEDLTAAAVTLQFKADVPGRRFQPDSIGDPFACTVTLRGAADEASYTAYGKCMPNNARVFCRSAYAHAAQRG